MNTVISASRIPDYFTPNWFLLLSVQKYTNTVTDHITVKSDFAHGCIKEAVGTLNPTKAKTSSNIFQDNSFHFVLFGGMYTASPRPQLYNLGFPHCFWQKRRTKNKLCRQNLNHMLWNWKDLVMKRPSGLVVIKPWSRFVFRQAHSSKYSARHHCFGDY